MRCRCFLRIFAPVCLISGVSLVVGAALTDYSVVPGAILIGLGGAGYAAYLLIGNDNFRGTYDIIHEVSILTVN
jgi:hypothetical protein